MNFRNLLQRLELEPHLTVLRRFLPALAFFCGFIWDAVTMGSTVTFYDLLILTSYYFAAGLILVLLGREIKPEWQNWFTFFIQFSYGGLFSALVVFYFKSAGSLYTFLVVVALVLLLVANEFLAESYRKRTMSWTMFAACGTMYLNFLIPHIVNSIQPVWFYLSCILSLTLVFAIHGFAVAKEREKRLPEILRFQQIRELWPLVPSLGVVLLLILLYQFQLIPPVPLVLKESYICKDFNKTDGLYQCQAEEQTLLQTFGFAEDSIHFQAGEKIYSVNAVFAPTSVAVDLEQRWWWRDEGRGTWLAMGVVPLPMEGGRKAGWRNYSYIQSSVRTGQWKVETALKDGAVLAIKHFTAKPQEEPAVATRTVTVN